ncbi:MAG TPA: uroporphyrinogen-III synthase [Ktedonobacterales bacterium]
MERTERPLAGKHIVITRPTEQARELAEALEALGARVTALPAIAIEPVAETAPLDAAIAELATYDWLVFTSVNGVSAFGARLAALGHTWADRGRARVAAIGPATARALVEVGVPPDLVPSEYVAEALGEALGNVAGQRILLPRADIAREALARELEVRGAEVSEIAAYRTVPRPIPAEVLVGLLDEASAPERADALTFTSSSTVRALVESLRAAGHEPARTLASVALAAIGPITAGSLREYGLEPALVAEEYSVPGLVRALVAYFAAGAAPRQEEGSAVDE